MLELHTTTAISQTVSEVVTNTLVNEGLSLLKVESGGSQQRYTNLLFFK